MTNYLFFDTETTGKFDFKMPFEHPTQPHLVQLAAILTDETGKEQGGFFGIVKPDGWNISEEVAEIHGVTQSRAERFGIQRKQVLFIFNELLRKSDTIVAHNMSFDEAVMRTQYYRQGTAHYMSKVQKYCTMRSATNVVKAPNPNGRAGFKWPTLTECIRHFFDEDIQNAHDAMGDTISCARVFWALKALGE